MNTSYSAAKAVSVPSSDAFLRDLFHATPLYLFFTGAKAALKA
jgi:hypothetical protein